MSDKNETEQAASDENSYELDSQRVQQIIEYLDNGEFQKLTEELSETHSADIADILEVLDGDHRKRMMGVLRSNFEADILAYLDEDLREELMELIPNEELAVAVAELDTDDQVEVLEDLDPEDQKEILEGLSDADRALVEESLNYPEDSAGRLMQREVVAVPEFFNVGQVIDHLRENRETLPDAFYDLFITDPTFRVKGSIPLSQVFRQERDARLGDLVTEELRTIKADTDQEEVAFLFRKYDLVSAPVVDENGRLLGVITVDDVVDIIEEEHEEDMMNLAGLGRDDFYRAIWDTMKSRFPWLSINIVIAFVVALSIGLFEKTIDEIVELAILMPVVALLGGNAGTQAMTVTVRALATKELMGSNASRVIGKEILVGLLNGSSFGIIGGIGTYILFGKIDLAATIAVAMFINLSLAGLFGTLIPIILSKLKADPAVSSSIFLTALTDIVGFCLFLALASLWLIA